MAEGTKNLVLGGTALALLLVAGYFTFQPGGDAAGGVPNEYMMYGVCLACQQEGEASLGLTELPPAKCSSCSAQAVYPWFICLNCTARFVPKLERPVIDEPLRLPLYKRCPLCRSPNVRQYDPQLDDEFRQGKDAPLPAWEE